MDSKAPCVRYIGTLTMRSVVVTMASFGGFCVLRLERCSPVGFEAVVPPAELDAPVVCTLLLLLLSLVVGWEPVCSLLGNSVALEPDAHEDASAESFSFWVPETPPPSSMSMVLRRLELAPLD